MESFSFGSRRWLRSKWKFSCRLVGDEEESCGTNQVLKLEATLILSLSGWHHDVSGRCVESIQPTDLTVSF